MSEPVTLVIQARCAHSRTLIRRTAALMPRLTPCCKRHDMARCAIDLACEHHRAIILLTESGELGAAAALQRSLLESSASAFWLTYIATDEQILSLPTDPADETSLTDIPMLTEVLPTLQPLFPDVSKMSEGFSKKGSRSARWLHKYTHGGTPQLARRDKASGWSEADVIRALIRADMFVVLGVTIETVITTNEDLRRFLFGVRDMLGDEFCETFKIPPIPRQPSRHPPSSMACCGPSFLLRH